jgi:hypothetical protein
MCGGDVSFRAKPIHLDREGYNYPVTKHAKVPQRGNTQQPREQCYNTHKSNFQTTVQYKYHPLFGKEVWVQYIINRGGRSFAKIESPEAYLNPIIDEWMIDFTSCGRVSLKEEPIVRINSLRMLRDLLDSQPFLLEAVSGIPSSDKRRQRRDDGDQAETTQARAGRRHLGAADGGCEEPVLGADKSSGGGAVGNDKRRIK